MLTISNLFTCILFPGCQAGYWGDRCNHRCGPDCAECEKTDGACAVCIDDMYGSQCSETCSVNCDQTVCGIENGTCTFGCTEGAQGPMCTSCVEGKYGDTCSESCSGNCNGTLCEMSTGNCPYGCGEGFWGDNCNSNCGNCSGKSCEIVVMVHVFGLNIFYWSIQKD